MSGSANERGPLPDTLDPSRPVVVLECGDGELAASLEGRFPRVVGADASRAAIERARKRASEVWFVAVDARRAGSVQALRHDLGDCNVVVNDPLRWLRDDERAGFVHNVAMLLGERGRLAVVLRERRSRALAKASRELAKLLPPEVWTIVEGPPERVRAYRYEPASARIHPGIREGRRGVAESLRNARRFGADPIAFYRGLTYDGGGYWGAARFDLFGPNLLVNDPFEAARILMAPAHEYSRDGLRFFAVMRRLLGRGLFTAEGEEHLTQSRLQRPHYAQRSIAEHAAARASVIDRFLDELAAEAGRPVDVQAQMWRLSLELLIGTLVGESHREEAEALAALNVAMEDGLIGLMSAPVLFSQGVPAPANLRFGSVRRRLRREVSRIVRRVQEADADPESLTSRIVRTLDDADISFERIRDEVLTIFAGGYKSTAAAFTWTLYLLSTRPEWVERLRREASAGADRTEAEMVVKESFRLYPPVWAINRRAARDDTVCGVPVAEGTDVTVSPFTLHRHPGHWERPDDFEPERFAPGRTRPADVYLPFGAGRHKCVGLHYVQAAVTEVAARFCHRFELSRPPEAIVPGTRAFSHAPRGVPLSFRPW